MKKSYKLVAMLLCFVMMFATFCSVSIVSAVAADSAVVDTDTEADTDLELDFNVENLPGMDYAISLIQNILHRIISICATVFDFLPFLDFVS